MGEDPNVTHRKLVEEMENERYTSYPTDSYDEILEQWESELQIIEKKKYPLNNEVSLIKQKIREIFDQQYKEKDLAVKASLNNRVTELFKEQDSITSQLNVIDQERERFIQEKLGPLDLKVMECLEKQYETEIKDIEILLSRGTKEDYYDPYAMAFQVRMSRNQKALKQRVINLKKATLRKSASKTNVSHSPFIADID